MKRQLLFFIIFMAIICIFPALAAPESTIPKGGTVFIGEQNLDISQCNVHAGDEIGWWESGNPQGVPTARTKVGDTSRFSITPDAFKGHTGTWYDMVGQKPVFTVEDPNIQLEVVENGLGDDKTWIKRGSMVSFKITTNMNALSKRPGCSGVLVSIEMDGPNGTAPKTVASSKNTEFDLSKIYVYSSPYDTGAAWDTSDVTKYPDGKYTFSAKTNTNLIYDNYKESGKTYSEDQTITLSKTKEKEDKSNKTDEKSSDKSETVSANSVKSDAIDSTEKVKSSSKVTDEPTDEPTKKPTAEETVEKSSKSSKSSSSSKVTDEPTDEPTKKPTAEETVEKSSKSSKSSSSSKVTDEPTDEPTKKPAADETVEKSSTTNKSSSSKTTDGSDEKSSKKETVTGIASFGNEPEQNTSKTEVTEKPTSRQTLTVTPVPTTTIASRTPTPQETAVKGAQAKPATNKSSFPHPPKTTQKAQPLSPAVAAGALMVIASILWIRRD